MLVEIIDDVSKSVQLSFTVLVDERIIISRQGHSAVVRRLSLDADDVSGGGWVFLKSRKITFYSGTHNWITRDQREDARSAIGRALRMYLRVAI